MREHLKCEVRTIERYDSGVLTGPIPDVMVHAEVPGMFNKGEVEFVLPADQAPRIGEQLQIEVRWGDERPT